MPRSLTLMLLMLALAVAGCGGGDSDDEPAPAAPAAPKPQAQSGGCQQVAAPEPKPDGGQQKPKRPLDPEKTYDVVLQTSCGSFTIRLDQRTSPATAASFAALARKRFFDGTVFHRIVPGFVIQGGDPTGTGMGGPGYSTRDKPPATATYTKGVVAMAKTPDEPAGTSGSQFYVVTGVDAGLPAEYALLGRVHKGLETVRRIGELGDAATEQPLQPVVVESATVRER